MLEGKNIIVTGCSQDIGKETLRLFAENGANVFACLDDRGEGGVNFCDELATKNHVQIIPIAIDMADNASIEEVANKILDAKMEIHGLVNISEWERDTPLGRISYQDIIDVFQANVFYQILLSQSIVKIMRQRKAQGSIVFTSNITAMDGCEGQTVYGASKAALIGVMKTMALELGKFGIRVNSVALGLINSDASKKLNQESMDRELGRMEIPRLGEVEEVAKLYMFLESDLSSHITGQNIRIDGGIG